MMSSDDDESGAIPKGRLKRFGKLMGLAGRTGAALVNMTARKALGERAEMNVEMAQHIVSTLGQMKGIALKLGQSVALGADGFSGEAKNILLRTLTQAPPMSWPQVQAVVESELQGPLENFFVEFEKSALAAASLGEVHRATLKTGEKVAVKVQYPDVALTIEQDLKNLSSAAHTLGLGGSLFDSGAYADEVADMLRQEIDYLKEKNRLSEFSTFLKHWPDLKAPGVFSDLCTHKLLVLEAFEGPTLIEFSTHRERYTDADRYRVSEQLIRAVYGPFVLHRTIHTDIHPGNFIVLEDNTLGVLDFGSTKEFSETFWQAYCSTMRATLEHNTTDLLSHIRQAGFKVELDEARAERLIQDISAIVARPFLAPYDFSQCHIRADVKALVKERLTDFLRVRPPKEGVFFYRAVFGLIESLRMIGAAGDFRPTFHTLLKEAP